jgi:methylglutaconyl-CoA hydratase
MLEVEVRDEVARVTLNRPEVHNAFDAELVEAMTSTFSGMAGRSDVRAIVLAARGRSFCAGGDLRWMRRTLELSPEENLADARNMATMFQTIAACPKPVLARVHGAALGGGAGLVAAVDIAVALDTAEFGFTEVRLGIVPGVISPYIVSRIGAGRAREYCLTGARFGARTAREIGLVHRVVSDSDELDEVLEARTADILRAGPQAVAATKALILDLTTEGVERGAGALARARSGREGREGIEAFLDRRNPPWAR